MTAEGFFGATNSKRVVSGYREETNVVRPWSEALLAGVDVHVGAFDIDWPCMS